MSKLFMRKIDFFPIDQIKHMRSSGAVRAACDIQIDGRRGHGGPS